jgi:hypothetical protein
VLAAASLWLAARSEAPASAVVICFMCQAHGVLSGFHSEFCMPLPYGARDGQLTAGATQARQHWQLVQLYLHNAGRGSATAAVFYCQVSRTLVQLFGAAAVWGCVRWCECLQMLAYGWQHVVVVVACD